MKLLLSPLLRWKPLADPAPGYTVILGVPWHLRHLLPVNLEFVRRTDRRGMKRLHVIFDRRHRPEMDPLVREVGQSFSDLPLRFGYYPTVAGRITEKVDVSTFYNSMNTVLGISECETRYAILHDFDLYPLSPRYFEEVYRGLEGRHLKFCGLELTHFEGLEDEDRILGTWCLGLDVAWLRSEYRPIHCFHRVARVNGRAVNLDPYSWIQTRTRERGLVETLDGTACCHVKNLCSTYLRFVTGRWAKIVWRLHYVWYLETLIGKFENFQAAIVAMESADSPILTVNSYEADFTGTDPGCAGFLGDELGRMEKVLFGCVRPEVERFVRAFRDFLEEHGAPVTPSHPQSVHA